MSEILKEGELETVYIEGDNLAFIQFIAETGRGTNANLASVEGNMRWVITRPDGSRYIARPQEAK